MRVVVIEDNDDLSELIGQRIELEIPDVSVMRIGEDFKASVEWLDWDEVDVAVVDIMLPGISGREIMYWLHTEYPNVRVYGWSAIAEFQTDIVEHEIIFGKPDIEGLIGAIRG